MPMDVLRKIMEKLTLKEHLALRKVSSRLRNLVDSSRVCCPRMEFHFQNPYSKIRLDEVLVIYSEASLKRWHRRLSRHIKCECRTSNADEKVIADASSMLKNPKLRIDHLELHVKKVELMDKLLEFLKALNLQLDVRSIRICTNRERTLSVLEFLKPENLEEISFNYHSMKLYTFRMDNLLNFKKLKKIEIEQFYFFDYNVIAIRDLLLKSPHLESCVLADRRQETRFMRNLLDVVNVLSQDPAYKFETRRFSIPNSPEYFQLEFDDDFGFNIIGLSIKKMSNS